MTIEEKVKTYFLGKKGLKYITNPNDLELPTIKTFGVWLDLPSNYKFMVLEEFNGYFTFEYKNKSECNLERESEKYAVSFEKIEDAIKFDIALLFYEMDFPVTSDLFIERVSPYTINGETTDSRKWFYIRREYIKDKHSNIRESIVFLSQDGSLYYEKKKELGLFRVEKTSSNTTTEFDDVTSTIRSTTKINEGTEEERTITLDIDYFEEKIPNELLYNLANIVNTSFKKDVFRTYHLINNLFNQYGLKIYSIRIMYVHDSSNTIEQNLDIISNNPIFLNVFVKINEISYRSKFDCESYIETVPLDKDNYRIEDLEYLDNECKKLLEVTKRRNLVLKKV